MDSPGSECARKDRRDRLDLRRIFFGVLPVFLLRARRSTVSTALIAAVFGFLLASTGVAPVVDSVLRGVAQAAHTLK